MTLKDQVLTACRNMGRRKIRSFLASLGVVVGIMTIVILISLASGVRQHINRQFESIGLDRITIVPPRAFAFRGSAGPFGINRNSDTKKIITAEDVARWQEWPGVIQVRPGINLPRSVELELKWHDKTQSVQMAGPLMRPGRAIWTAIPEPLAGNLELPNGGGIVLSQGITRSMGFEEGQLEELVGQNVQVVLRTSRGETQSFDLKVQGVSSDMSTAIQVSTDDCLSMKCWWFNDDTLMQTEGYDFVVVNCSDVSRAKDLTERFREDGVQVQSLDVFVDMANRIVTIITIMLVMLASVALLVASIGIVNTMFMAVYERTREIGVLKALGASGWDIQCLVMIESGFIGLLGGVLGLLAGWGTGVILNKGILWYLEYREQPIHGVFFVVTPALALSAGVFAAFIGIAAGWFPSRRASRLDPLEALRHE